MFIYSLGRDFVQLLQEFGIPIPDVLYPFQIYTFPEDFGSLGLDLSLSETEDSGYKYYRSWTDKYGFVSHMISSNGGSARPNARLSRSNLSPITNIIDASNGFTVAVHLYWLPDSLNYKKEKWYMMRDNGTIFVFQKDKKRFIVKDYPDGLLFRYVQ